MQAADPDSFALQANNLRKSFGKAVALDGLALAIARGEIYGLLGANGAGKTTALRIICGLLKPDDGEGHCLGAALGSTPPGLGYMPQRGGLYDDLSIRENLLFAARARGLRPAADRVAAALTEHGLEARAAQRVGGLSGGWRQRVALAAALLHAPGLLLLDEPSAGLDPQTREALWQRLRALSLGGATILVTTHYADEAERCDRIGYLERGRLRVEGASHVLPGELGLVVWRLDAKSGQNWSQGEKLGKGIHALRDSAGWRIIGRDDNLPEALRQRLEEAQAQREAARLTDALSWLAAANSEQSP